MPRPVSLDHDAVLDAALELFWQRGYHEVSVDDLVRETGLNRHSLYDRYRSKYGLAVAALERYCSQGTRRLQGVLFAPGSPSKRLHHFLRLRDPDSGDSFWRRTLDRGCFAVRMVTELRAMHPEVPAIAGRAMDLLVEDVTAVVHEGQKGGELRSDLEPSGLARTIVAGWLAALLVPEEQRRAIALAALD